LNSPSLAKKGCHASYRQSIYFQYRKLGIQNGALPWVFGKAFSTGFFVHLVAHSAPAAKRHIHSLRPIRLIFTASIDFSARRCERIRTLNLPRRPCHWIDAGEIGGPVWSVSDRGTARAFRSSRADSGAQVLPPARATVPPWLPAKSARVSNLPACCALGPPACAAPCSCHHEACSARSAWPHPDKACPSV